MDVKLIRILFAHFQLCNIILVSLVLAERLIICNVFSILFCTQMGGPFVPGIRSGDRGNWD